MSKMILIDQRRIRGLRPSNRTAGGFRTTTLHRDGDDHEVLILEFGVELLPHGQIESAASPARPGREEDLLSAEVGEAVELAGDVRQREVRGLEALELGASVRGGLA